MRLLPQHYAIPVLVSLAITCFHVFPGRVSGQNAPETIMTDIAALPKTTVRSTLSNFPSTFSKINFLTPDGRALVSSMPKKIEKGVEENLIFLWSMEEKKIVKSTTIPSSKIQGKIFGVSHAHLSAGGRILAVGMFDGKVFCWDLKGGKQLELRPHERFLSSVAVSPDGKSVVSAGLTDKGQDLVLSKASREKNMKTIAKEKGVIHSLCFSDDGALLACGVSRGVKVLETTQYECLWEKTKAHGKERAQIVWLPDSRTLISAAADEKIIRWDARSGRMLSVMTGHGLPTHHLAVSRDGRWLASSGVDKSTGISVIILWSLETGKGVCCYQYAKRGGMQDYGDKIAFLPDSSELLVFAREPFILDGPPSR